MRDIKDTCKIEIPKPDDLLKKESVIILRLDTIENYKINIFYFKDIRFELYGDSVKYTRVHFIEGAERFEIKVDKNGTGSEWRKYRDLTNQWELGVRSDGIKMNIENKEIYDKTPDKRLWVNMSNLEYLNKVLKDSCEIIPPHQGGETENTPCSNTGQFGGGGTALKDIKLFLYANNVTKGTITLSNPQVEVGTYATDWRPNPADATKSIEMMLKQIKSVRKGGRKNGKKRD